MGQAHDVKLPFHKILTNLVHKIPNYINSLNHFVIDKGHKNLYIKMVNKAEFPIEHIVELKELSPYLVGRVTIYQNLNKFDTEVDIVLTETGKIYNHVGQVFSQSTSKEAFDLSYRKLKIFLRNKV